MQWLKKLMEIIANTHKCVFMEAIAARYEQKLIVALLSGC